MANGLFGGGSGTTTAPYLVEDAADLDAVRKLLAMHYKQTAHIDMALVANHVPIGTSTSPFTGSYDGGDFEIRNLTITGPSGYSGLFGRVNSPGVIRNIHVKNGNVKPTAVSGGSGYYNGTIVGYYNGGQHLENVSFQGVADFSSYYSAGLVGGHSGATEFIKCRFEGTLYLGASGGYGISWNSAIHRDCHFKGVISSLGTAQGITGGQCFDCTFDGEIIATNEIYGITSGQAQRCSVSGTKIQSTNAAVVGVGGTAIDCTNNMANIIAKTSAYGISLKLAVRCLNYSDVFGETHAAGISGYGADDCSNRGPLVKSAGMAAGVTLAHAYISNAGYYARRCMCSANVESTGTHAAGIMIGGYSPTNTSWSYAATSCYFLGGHVKGLGASTANIGRISAIPLAGNKDNYSIDTSRIILE